MASSSLLEQLSPLVAGLQWDRVRDALVQADRDGQAGNATLELLAEASWWLGQANECIEGRRAGSCPHPAHPRSGHRRSLGHANLIADVDQEIGRVTILAGSPAEGRP